MFLNDNSLTLVAFLIVINAKIAPDQSENPNAADGTGTAK